jgi:hypothetical protein
MDILISKKVTENNYLNSKQNIKIAEAYYTGDQTKSVHMDWLLTFIFWSTSNKIS